MVGAPKYVGCVTHLGDVDPSIWYISMGIKFKGSPGSEPTINAYFQCIRLQQLPRDVPRYPRKWLKYSERCLNKIYIGTANILSYS
jgi:hypothetical protein